MAASDIFQLAFLLLVVAPIAAMFLSFKGSPGVRRLSRFILLAAWLVYGIATLACLWAGFFKPSTGIGHGIFLIIAIPVGIVAGIGFSVWRAAHRHEYVLSLPPDMRRHEELIDIDRGLEAARASLASAQSKLGKWGQSASDRRRLEAEISAARFTIQSLEKARAERQ
ncbi:hypothetical protein NR798_42740 [Archangium gephyra]|uniref:hypothetical protein n=1 Tax=Archangium gephyra TaxID=48 RepID=UPI0035D420A8